MVDHAVAMATLFERLRVGVTTSSAAETRALAATLAENLPADVALALHGDLGVGKTTFVQGLAHGLGIREPVTSPTFNIYTVHRGSARTLVHLDAYRIERGQELEELLLEDFLVTPWCLAVEWPDRIRDWLPRDTFHFDLGITAEQQHTVRMR